MKQINVTVSFEEEKLAALKRYMNKKGLEPESEFASALSKLYEKYVPAPVREYIDENDVPTAKEKPKRHGKSAAQELPEENAERTVVNDDGES